MRLDIIFDHVYQCVGIGECTSEFSDEILVDLLATLQAMQQFNYKHRPDGTSRLYRQFDQVFNFEANSEGTTLWLCLILAIKELYGFSDRKLHEVLSQVKIRK